jgi:hypothetical protein
MSTRAPPAGRNAQQACQPVSLPEAWVCGWVRADLKIISGVALVAAGSWIAGRQPSAGGVSGGPGTSRPSACAQRRSS